LKEHHEPKVVDLTRDTTENDDKQKDGEDSGDMDYDYEDEDFGWFQQSMVDQTYFVLVNCDRRTIKKGEQTYYCYGKRSNAFLLLK
jgi:hypothetical protein